MKYYKNILGIFLLGFFILNCAYLYGNLTSKPQVKSSQEYFPNSSSEPDKDFAWDLIWGGIYDDCGQEVATDSQNYVYLVGYTDITGSDNCDILISKYDADGQEIWVKTWGGSYDDKGFDIFIDASDNIFIVGYTKSLGDTDGDIVIIQFDTLGNEIFNKTWGGPQYEIGKHIFEDLSGNFYVSGETCSLGDLNGDALIVKFDDQFEEIWNVTWGGSELDIANKAEIGSNNYLYVVGHSNSVDPNPGYSDVFLLKYDLDGNYQWVRTWGTSFDQRGNSLALDSNDNIYITGYSFGHPASSGKGFLLKYDSNGNYQWERIWGVDGQYGNYFYRIIIDNNDDLYISGCTKTYGIPNNYDALLLNYDTLGNQNWNKIWMGSGVDATPGICMDSRSNIYIVGYTETNSTGGTDVLLIKFKNDSEITIITPENRTYTEPDSGYYPATYGFENDQIGVTPTDWVASGQVSSTVQVVDAIDNHKNVMDLYDKDLNDEYNRLYNVFSDQPFGTIEFWWRTDDISKPVYFGLSDGTYDYENFACYFYSNGTGGWNSRNGGGTTGGITYPIPNVKVVSNKWHHTIIQFECSNGQYNSLHQYTWKLIIDDLDSGELSFKENRTTINRFTITPSSSSLNYHEYLDAVGYSWDPKYNVGDNLNEGLLLSYENTTALDWHGYSLDGASNKTIFGNTVIPLPADGNHAIQVFGNDSFGNFYKSNIRYFSIDTTSPHISILSPLQNSYFSYRAPEFQITTSGKNLSIIFYQINDSTFFCEANQGQINQALWEGCAEGLVVINFYVNNTLGNYSMAELAVYKDSISPYVSTYYSYEGRVYHTVEPTFYLNIYDVNLDLTWYTLNNGSTEYYFTGQYLGIDQELWDNLDDGIIIVTLYATDKAGNGNCFNFYVIKDTLIVDPFYPPYLAIAIGGIVLLGVIVSLIVIVLNKKSPPRTRTRYYDQIPYHSQPATPKQYEYPIPKRILKCPYCSYEKDIDGNFCPQCGARLR